jgi:hypothetical protein
MSFWNRIAKSNFVIKLKSWEYWPFGIIQFPLFIYWLWLSARARSLFFFSASNPGIVMGGMFGESKYDVIKKIPQVYVPKTLLIKIPASKAEVLNEIRANELSFPLIFKPDLGERGYLVKKIKTEQQVEQYLDHRVNFLIQEFIDLPLEFGVFYTRFPNEPNGRVSSIVMKEMLDVIGDGQSTLAELILNKDRAKLQWEKLRQIYQEDIFKVIPRDKRIELVSIGNHALGTKFLDGNYLINEKLSASFDAISKQIDGFYFGRFDLRCGSSDDLLQGRVKIMELNGCGAEPAHIYEPGYPLFKAIRVLFSHWKNIYLVSRQNHDRGVKYVSFLEARKYYNRFKAAIR